ncbi:MAG: hypothetical protein D6780_02285, partial [Candidatus Dadabacteria bacterium]
MGPDFSERIIKKRRGVRPSSKQPKPVIHLDRHTMPDGRMYLRPIVKGRVLATQREPLEKALSRGEFRALQETLSANGINLSSGNIVRLGVKRSSVDELYLSGSEIQDLSPLQEFKNLRRLTLEDVSAPLSPLTKVSSLESLTLIG